MDSSRPERVQNAFAELSGATENPCRSRIRERGFKFKGLFLREMGAQACHLQGCRETGMGQ